MRRPCTTTREQPLLSSHSQRKDHAAAKTQHSHKKKKLLKKNLPPNKSLRAEVFTVEFYPVIVCVCSVAQSCPNLCNPMDCNPPGSSVHGIFEARILEWVAMASSRGCSQPRDQTHTSWSSCTGRQILSLPLRPPEKPSSI